MMIRFVTIISIILTSLTCSSQGDTTIVIYRANGIIKSSVQYDSNYCANGPAKYYFPNGNLKTLVTHRHGFIYGQAQNNSRDGKVKSEGFLDGSNYRTLFFRPVKTEWTWYNSSGNQKKGISSTIEEFPKNPIGKCLCLDTLINQFTGLWKLNEIIPFPKDSKITDPKADSIDSQIEFFDDLTFTLTINNVESTGKYEFTSNKLIFIERNVNEEFAPSFSLRWPKKTNDPYPRTIGIDVIYPIALIITDRKNQTYTDDTYMSFVKIR